MPPHRPHECHDGIGKRHHRRGTRRGAARLSGTQRSKTDLYGDIAQTRQFKPERGDGKIRDARGRGIEVPGPGEILLGAAEHAFEQGGQPLTREAEGQVAVACLTAELLRDLARASAYPPERCAKLRRGGAAGFIDHLLRPRQDGVEDREPKQARGAQVAVARTEFQPSLERRGPGGPTTPFEVISVASPASAPMPCIVECRLLYRLSTIAERKPALLELADQMLMPTAEAEAIATVAKALAHPVRVRIIAFLLSRPGCIGGDIVDEVGLAQSTVSEHLRILKASGLVVGAIEHPRICYSLNPSALAPMRGLIDAIAARAADCEAGLCYTPQSCVSTETA